MSTKPVEEGRWAVIVKGSPCCGSQQPGHQLPFVVLRIIPHPSPIRALMMTGCPFMSEYGPLATGVLGDANRVIPVCMLKRIDEPPDLNEEPAPSVQFKEPASV